MEESAVPQTPVTPAKLPKILIIPLVIIAFIVGGLAGYFLKARGVSRSPKLSTTNCEKSGAVPSKESEYRTGNAIYFKFLYPTGWHVFAGILDQKEAADPFVNFRLNPEPIWKFPEFVSFIEGNGYLTTNESALEERVAEFKKSSQDIKDLSWKTGAFNGSCFEYSSGEEGGMFGKVVGNIKCFVYVEKESNKFVYDFDVSNASGALEKIDPGKKIIQHFFESLGKIK